MSIDDLTKQKMDACFRQLKNVIKLISDAHQRNLVPANCRGLLHCNASSAVSFIELGDAEVNVGRSSDCWLIIDDKYLSKVQFKIYRLEEFFVLSDCGSKNGTSVNGELVNLRTLVNGDCITAGKTTLLYVEN